LPCDTVIQGPDAELRIFSKAGFYFWKIWNRRLAACQDVQLRIDSFQSFDSSKREFREPIVFNVPWRIIRTLDAGAETDDVVFVRFEGDTLGFGNGNGMYLLGWPAGDRSTTRCWRLNIRVVGLIERWPIRLCMQWTFGSKVIDFREEQPPGIESSATRELKMTDSAGLQRELQAERDRETLIRKLERDCIDQKLKYPKQLYHPDGSRQVTFSIDKHVELKLQGWLDDPLSGETVGQELSLDQLDISQKAQVTRGGRPPANLQIHTDKVRVARGTLSQAAFARQCRISADTLQRAELKGLATEKTIMAICKAATRLGRPIKPVDLKINPPQ